MWCSLISFLILCLPTAVFGKAECKTHLDPNVGPSKIFLNVFNWVQPVRNPETKNGLISDGQLVNLECGNGFVRKDFPGKSYAFQCTDGKFNRTFPLEELLCRSNYHKLSLVVQISPTQLRSKIFKCDGKDWEAYQMKTVQPDGSSKLLYVVCLDAKVMRPKFVFQPSTNEAPPKGLAFEERTDVWGFDGYGKNVNEMLQISKGYVGNTQRNRTTNSFSQKYNSRNQYPYYFNRGHLVPYADFKDPNDRKATCQYFNAAPQWEEFNKNQWSLVEREARSMRQNNASEWEVYTGTYGNIPTTRGPLFLAPVFENRRFKKGLLPVPMLYWKLVYNTNDKTKSKAFVGVNNPEIRSPQDIVNKYRICAPIPSANSALIEGSEFFGFTYQCKVDEFIKALNDEEKIIVFAWDFPGEPLPSNKIAKSGGRCLMFYNAKNLEDNPVFRKRSETVLGFLPLRLKKSTQNISISAMEGAIAMPLGPYSYQLSKLRLKKFPETFLQPNARRMTWAYTSPRRGCHFESRIAAGHQFSGSRSRLPSNNLLTESKELSIMQKLKFRLPKTLITLK